MRAVLYAMGKEVAPPFDKGHSLPNAPRLTLRQLSKSLLVCVCGVGKVNAALAAQYLIDHVRIAELWNAGVAGCLTDLPAGTLVAVTGCVQHDIDTFGDPPGLVPVLDQVELPCTFWEDTLGALTDAGLNAVPGVAASGDWFGRDLDRAAFIRDHFNALVCDMEAGAIAQVCARSGVPFHALKVVSDHLFHPSQYEEYQANLPAAVEQLNRGLAKAMYL